MSYTIENDYSDNVYVNINFPSPILDYSGAPSVTTGNEFIPMEYDITRNSDILSKPSEYYCSIIRFDIPLNSIPELICPIVPNQINPNLSTHIVGISYLTGNYPTQLIYTPQNNELPPTQNQKYQVVTPYYYMYSFNDLINMINVGLAQSYTNSGIQSLFPSVDPPYLFFDPVTQLLNLVVNEIFTSNPPISPLTAVPVIYINSSLISFLDSFQFKYNNPTPQPNGKDYIFDLTSTFNLVPFGNVPNYYVFTGAYSVMQYWSASRKLVFTSSSIPIQKEYIPSLTSSAEENVLWPIITDFTLNLNDAGDNRSIAYYNPTSQYRLVDLQSTAPLRKINIKVYWQDIFGNYIPMSVNAGQYSSLKIAFLRKSLYKANGNLLKK